MKSFRTIVGNELKFYIFIFNDIEARRLLHQEGASPISQDCFHSMKKIKE